MAQYRYCRKCSESNAYGTPFSFVFRGIKLKSDRFRKCKECSVKESKRILKKWFDLFCTIADGMVLVDWAKFKESFPQPFREDGITDEEVEVLMMLNDIGILCGHKENGFWYIEGIGQLGPRNNVFMHRKDAQEYAEVFYSEKDWEVKELWSGSKGLGSHV